MLIKNIEISDVLEIKEPIMNYARNGNKLYISSVKRTYSINYNLENEKKAFKLFKDSIDLCQKEKDDNLKEIKGFKKFLAVAFGYMLFFIVLGGITTSFIPLIFTMPSLIFGSITINNLRELKKENKALSSILVARCINLKYREEDLNKNISIEAQKEEQEIQSIENLSNSESKEKENTQKPKRKSLSLYES